MSPQTMPTVSIVIVSWNAKSYLRECLESLKGDAYAGPTEIIVVDNASADGSAEMVREDFPDVTLVCNAENLGFAKANNIGIRQCVGEFISLVNSDVRAMPDCITTLVAYCQARPRAGLVGPYIVGGDGKQQRSCRASPTLWNMFCRALSLDLVFPRSRIFNGYFMGYWDHRTTRPVDILSGCFWLTRRPALDQVGLLDELFFIYGEDMDWCKRFRDVGWSVDFVPGAEAIHYGGASSANSPVRFFVEKQKADLQYWRKHHSQLAVRVYCAISLVHHSLRIVEYSLLACVVRREKQIAWYKVRRSVACVRAFLTGGVDEVRSV